MGEVQPQEDKARRRPLLLNFYMIHTNGEKNQPLFFGINDKFQNHRRNCTAGREKNNARYSGLLKSSKGGIQYRKTNLGENIMENCAIEDRVVRYWTIRSHDFGAVRKNELGSIMGRRWQEELEAQLPQGRRLNILDVGTGTGFLPFSWRSWGHKVTGIDLTPAMLEEAAAMAASSWADIAFRHMDAQQLDFPDGTFDVVLSRNLTWTLPEPEKAYAEWHRVLKPGGLLLNFDADYAANVPAKAPRTAP